jgi:hypothetical protein
MGDQGQSFAAPGVPLSEPAAHEFGERHQLAASMLVA